MRYTVSEIFILINKVDGRRVSPYGAAPWNNDAEKSNWELKSAGFTLCDSMFPGTIGIGRQASKTIKEAQAMCDEFNAKDAANHSEWRKHAVAHALASPNASDKAVEWARKSLAAKKQPEMRYSKKVQELAEKEAFKMLRENKSKEYVDVRDAYFDAAYREALKS